MFMSTAIGRAHNKMCRFSITFVSMSIESKIWKVPFSQKGKKYIGFL